MALVAGGLEGSIDTAGATSGAATTVAFLNATGVSTVLLPLKPALPTTVPIAVENTGTAPSSSGVPTLELVVPSGLTIRSVDATATKQTGPTGQQWSCTTSGTATNCSMRGAVGRPVLPVAAGSRLMAYVSLANTLAFSRTLKMSDKTLQATGALPGAGSNSETLHFSLNGPAPDRSAISTGLQLQRTGSDTAALGSTVQVSYTVVNPATTADMRSGTHPAVAISGVLAPGVVSSWTNLSSGWSCTGPPSSSPVCALTTSTLGPGATSAPLTLSYTLGRSVARIGRTQLSTSANPLVGTVDPWSSTLVSYSSGTATSERVAQRMMLLPRSAGHLQVDLRPEGPSSLVRGSSGVFDIVHFSGDGVPTGLTDTLTLPPGLSMSPIVSSGWSCPGGSSTVTCTYAGAFPAATLNRLSPTFNVSGTAPLGVASITVRSISGDGLVTSRSTTPVSILDSGGATIAVHRVTDATGSTPVTDGSLLPALLDGPTDVYIAVSSTGFTPIQAGDVVHVSVTPSAGITQLVALLGGQVPVISLTPLTPLTPSSGGPCSISAGQSLSCSVTLQQDLYTGPHPLVLGFVLTVNKNISVGGIRTIAPRLAGLFTGGHVADITSSVTGDPHQVAPSTMSLDVDMQTQAASVNKSHSTNAASGTPNAPTNLVATPGNGEVKITFTPPSSSGSSAIYNYAYSENGSSTFYGFNPAVTASPVTIKGLTNGTTYSIRLGAVNGTGLGQASASVSVTPVGPAAAPTGLVATAGNGQATVSFTAPTSNGGAPITDYAYALGGSTHFTSLNPASTTSPVTIPGLTNGDKYSIELAAVTSAGGGTASASVSVKVGLVPSAPSGVAVSPGNDQATIAFDPSSANGSTVTDYQYQLNGGSWVSFSPNVTTTPGVITGLQNGSSYSVALRAVNAIGDSTASSPVSVTLGSYPGAPTNLVATRGNGQASIAFTPGPANGSTVTDYQYQLNGGTWVSVSPAVTGSPVVIGGLTNGASYSIRLAALTASGAGAQSATVSVTPAGPPSAPSGLVATPGNGSANLSFTPGAANGSTITNYQYQLNGGGWVPLSPASIATTVTVAGLANGTSYSIGLEAVSSLGPGAPSVAVAVTPTNLPNPPVNLVATPGDGQASIAFTPGASNGSGVTNYDYSVGGGTTWTPFSPAVTASPVTVTGLTDGTAATIELRAENANGPGAASSPVTVTPAAASSTPPAACPSISSGQLSFGPATLTVTAASCDPTGGQLSGSGTLVVAGATLAVTFSYTDANDWTATATGTFSLFGATPSASGTITDTSGAITGTFTASLPSATVDGVSLTAASVTYTWDGPLSGGGTLSVGGASLTIAFSFADANDWSLSANGSFSIFGATPTASGSIADAGGVITGTFTATLLSAEVGGVALTNSSVTYTLDGPLTGGGSLAVGGLALTVSFSYTDANDWMVAPTGSLSILGVTVGFSGQITDAASHISGSFTGTLPSLNLGGGSLTKASVTYDLGGELTGGGTFGVSLPLSASLNLTVTVTVDGPTTLVIGQLGSGSSALGDSGISLNSVAYYAAPSGSTTVTLSGSSLEMPANSLYLGGGVTVPEGLTSFFGQTFPSVAVTMLYQGPTVFSVTATVPEGAVFPTGTSDYTFAFSSFELAIADNGITGLSTQLTEVGTLTISGATAGGAPQTIDIDAAVELNPTTNLVAGSISAIAQGTASIWANAFGLTGFDINALTVSVGEQDDLPDLGLEVSANLPTQVLQSLGMSTGAPFPVMGLANISVANACVDVSFGTEGGPAIIDMGGVVTASYADLVLAPYGCVVGPYTIAPGFGVDFQGSFLGAPVTLSATIDEVPTFAFSGSATIGKFVAGPVTFDGATISASFNTGTGATVVSFSGAASLLGVSLTLSGTASEDPATSTSSMSLTGALGTIDLGGFELRDLTFSASYVQSGSTESFTLSGSGELSIMGSWIDVSELTFAFTNGQITNLQVVVTADISIPNAVTVDATFNLYANTVTNQFSLTATGTVLADGFSLTNASVDIDTSGFSFTGTLNVAGLVKGQLSGEMYWSTPICTNGVCPTIVNAAGVLVTAQKGDFNFTASNLAITIGPFATTGSVTVGDVGGEGWTALSAGLTLDNQGSPAVMVSGSFTTTGQYTFDGVGNVKYAGFGVTLNVSASNTTGATVVAGSTSIAVADGPNVALSGSFTVDGSGVATTLMGTVDFDLSTFNLGSASFKVAVAPGSESFGVSSSLNLAGIFTGSLSGTFASVGNQAGFSFDLSTAITIPTVAVTGSLDVSNMSGTSIGSFTAKVNCSYSWNGIVFTLSTPVNPSWSFNYTSEESYSYNPGGTIDLGLFNWSLNIGGSYYVSLSTGSPYIAFSFSGSGALSQQNYGCSSSWYNCLIGKGWGWGGWYNLISISVSFNSAGDLTACYDGTCWSSTVAQNISSTAPPTAPDPPGTYGVAQEQTNGNLWLQTAISNGGGSWLDSGGTMATGTSPSSCELNSGYIIAFQGVNDDVWIVGAAGASDVGLGMMPGTSPSIVCLGGTTYEIAFQANTSTLWVTGSAALGTHDMYLGMEHGADPSIAGADNGTNWDVAFEANTQTIWTVGSGLGATNTGYSIAPGSNPSIAYCGGGKNGLDYAFSNASDQLYVEGYSGAKYALMGYQYATLAPGSSPGLSCTGNYRAIASMYSSGYAGVIAVNTSNGSSSGVGFGEVMAGTEMSLIAYSSGFDAAYVNPSGDIEVGSAAYGSISYTITNLNLPVTPGSNASIFYD